MATELEAQKAIESLQDGKAPGSESILADVFKSGGQVRVQKLTKLLQIMWLQDTILQGFKDASVTHLCKRKGSMLLCDNHRGISFLVTAAKILARVILNRLIQHLEDGHLLDSQFGFRKGRGTADMVFAAQQ